MFEAQLLIAKTADYKIYSPWFPRQGDNVTVTLERVEVDGGSLSAQAVTKNSEDAGNGTAIGSVITVDGTKSVDTTDVTGEAKELVRYEFTMSGDPGNWVLFRMLPPVWFDTV